MRIVVGMTGSSGTIFGVEFLKHCPNDKYLILSEWGEKVLQIEVGMTKKELEPYVKKIFPDTDLASPFSSGSNPFDAFVIIPCSISTLAKIAAGISDTLITRVAQVALKERRRMVVALRETPLPTSALENSLKLSREGVVVMPISPPWYKNPESMEESVVGFVNKVLRVIGVSVPGGWREEELL
ncbi:UbiX family flavin prenyltransferase [candidate division TA06 bacterium]|nr:UbiX family flavin prenyltransferase [candidate division TA06 bacterium]